MGMGTYHEEGGDPVLRAVFNDVVLAEAPRTVRVEGNHYFSPQSLNREYFSDSPSRTVCLWKGVASYYNIHVEDEIVPDAAWSYKHPSPLARKIKNHVAFYGQVRIEGEPEGSRRGWLARLRRDPARGQWPDYDVSLRTHGCRRRVAGGSTAARRPTAVRADVLWHSACLWQVADHGRRGCGCRGADRKEERTQRGCPQSVRRG